jgi:hypothetical protein
MSRARSALLAIALAGCASLAAQACKRSAPAAAHARDAGATAVDATASLPRATTAALDSVQVQLHGRVERVLDGRALGRTFARCLIEGGAPVVALAEQAPPGEVVRHLALTLDVTAHEPTAGAPELGVNLDVVGRWPEEPGAPGPAASLAGVATPRRGGASGVDPADAAAAAVTIELAPRLCALLTTRLTVWATDDLRPALGSGDPALARWALVVLAGRPAPADPGARLALVDAIAPWLAGAPDVRDAAIAAVVALGDPRAVARLTAATDVGDEAAIIRVIDAVTRLGGDDARDYLQVMTSHRDGGVARAAKVGLAALALDDDAAR